MKVEIHVRYTCRCGATKKGDIYKIMVIGDKVPTNAEGNETEQYSPIPGW